MLGKFLILATVALAYGRPSDPETRTFVPSDLCPPDQSHWLLPHEYDCTKFYYCEYGLKWDTPRDCALGTEFSFELQVCVHPFQANCNLPGSPPTEAPTTTPEPTTTTTTPEPTTTTTTPEPTTTTTTPEPTTTTTTPEPTTTTPEPTTTTTTPEPTTTTTTPEPTTTTTTPEPTTTTTTPEPTTTTTTPEPTTTTTTPEPTTTTTTPEPTTTTTTPEPTTTTTTPEPTTTTTTPEPTTTTTTPEPTTTSTTPEPTTTTTTPEPTTTTTTPEPTTTTTTPEPTTTTTTPEATTTTTTPELTTTTTTPEPTTTTTTPEQTTTTQAPTTTQEPSTTTQASDPDLLPNGCPADFEVHQLLPHANCSKFYYCNFGEKVERDCAPGTHFNPVKQIDYDGFLCEDCFIAATNRLSLEAIRYSASHCVWCERSIVGQHSHSLPTGPERDHIASRIFPRQVCDWPWNAGCQGGDNGDNGNGDGGNGDNGNEDNGSGDGDNGGTLPNGCPADFEVHQLLPHANCSKFYYCNFGEKVERECAAGTHFNPVEQVCDWPWNAGCQDGGNGDSGNGDGGNGDNGSGDNGSGDNGGGDNGSGDNGGTLPNGCPADFEVHQLLPHANCSKFYYCNFGEKFERECAAGTHFNPVEQVCDWPWNAGCQDGGNGDSGNGDGGNGDNGSGDNGSGDNGSGDNGSGDNGGTLPNGCPADFEVHQLLPHANCSKFYYCNFGEKVERECAAGTHFNPVEQVCDWPWNAGCQDGGNGDNGNGDGGNGDNGTGDNGDGDNGDGDNGDGDNGDGDNGDGDNGDGDNGDGDNGDGDNGDGDNGDGDNGDGDNGDGDNGDGSDGNDGTLPNGCPADFEKHQLLPHANCSKFYYCVFGEKVERECAPGTHFNAEKQVCDWPWNAGCDNGNGNENEEGGDGGNGDGDNGDGDNGSGDNGSGDNGSGDNGSGDNGSGDNGSGDNGSGDNGSGDNGSGDNGSGDNGSGDNGSGDNGSGDNGSGDNGSGDNGSGDNGSGDGGTLPNGCPADFDDNQLLPHANCSKFYYCVYGEKVETECAAGTHFNPVEQVCDWPWNAGCDDSYGGNGNEDSDDDGDEDGGNGDGGNEDGGDGDNGNGDNGNEDGDNGNEDGNGDNDNGNGDGGNGDGGSGGSSNDNKCKEECNILPWAHETDCDKYWRCEGEKAVLVTCSEGLHFNAQTATCDFICNANCERDEIQSTAEASGLKLFVPWDKVDNDIRHILEKQH